VTTTKDQTVTEGHSVEVDPVRWQELLDELLGRVAGRFARVDLRQRARAFVRGLLSDLPRKNCWTIAEYAGDPNPDGMQHLLARAVWDQDAVRDDVRAYIVEHLGDPEAVLVVDETGDLKKGTTTVGVKRQYTGTAGRIENAQMAVYLVYATAAGHAVIDRELYLPRSWTDDPQRLQAVGVPDQVGFATKPALATRMITRALDVEVPASWVAGDEVDGANPGLRAELEARQIGYVLAVACDHRVPFGGATQRADALLRHVPARAWQQVSCGKGTKGHRHYDWAFLRLDQARLLLTARRASTGSWSAATTKPVSWPSTAATPLARCRWPSWSGSRAGAGPSRSASRPARDWLGWTTTRSPASAPGTGGSPSPCSPPPSWSWRP
jgi:SRSO17 transposase